MRFLNSSEETDQKLKGNFSWSSKGDKIELEGVEEFSEYQVGELFLLLLNENGKELKPVPEIKFNC